MSLPWKKAALAGIACTVGAAAFSVAPTQAATTGLTFTTNVTAIHGSLPLFALSHSAAPTALVASVLGNRAGLGLERTRLVARDSSGVEDAFVDGITGDAEVHPDLTASSGPVRSTAATVSAASTVFGRTDFIPKDATTATIGDVKPVLSAQVKRLPNGSTQQEGATTQLFTYVSAARTAAGLPVVGAGSRATVAIGNDGTVRGLVRHWQTAARVGTVAATLTSAQLANAITAQLRPLENANTAITVDSITPAYYDGDAHYLQPVYEFYATLHSASGRKAADHVRGYIPMGKTVEALPVIGQSRGSAPLAAALTADASSVHAMSTAATISLGEYANRDGSMEDQAYAYLDGFDAVPAGRYGPQIVRTQWLWAYPFEVEANANSYLNAVNIAYTMPHGDWWENTTLSNNQSFWYVTDIGVSGNPGYGAATGGKLATWIIDSCEVIPSMYDTAFAYNNGGYAFSPWWGVFKGLHRALGFRTEMLLGEDTMNYDVALDMAEGANANAAYLDTVSSFSFGTYPDYHLNNMLVHYDRASIMYDPRNANESIYSVQGQSASNELINVWYGN